MLKLQAKSIYFGHIKNSYMLPINLHNIHQRKVNVIVLLIYEALQTLQEEKQGEDLGYKIHK